LKVALGAAPFWFWLVLAVAALHAGLLPSRRLGALAGWIITAMVAVLLASGSPVVEVRYFDAVVLGGALVAALSVSGTRPSNEREPRRWLGAALACAAVVGATAAAGTLRRTVQGNETITRAQADEWVTTLRRSGQLRVAVPMEVVFVFLPYASTESFTRWADNADSARRSSHGLSALTDQFKLDANDVRALELGFTEKEQAFIARARMGAIAPADTATGAPLEVELYTAHEGAARFGAATVERTALNLASGSLDALVVETDKTLPEGLARFRRQSINERFALIRADGAGR
jgi:hypothetical protein